MKKLYLFAMAALLLAACSSEEPTPNKGNKGETPSTEVYAMGKMLTGVNASNTPQLMASDFADVTGNYATAYFYIRIDGRIPVEPDGSFNSKDYWPCDPSKGSDNGSVFANENSGKVNVDYPYWKSCATDANVKQYIYDTTGEAVNKVISDIPSFESMMSVNKKDVEKVKSINTKGLKIIWYVAKYTYGRWHVDGVLTYENVKDVTEVPGIDGEKDMENSADEVIPELGQGNIEVDVHQQEHKDWQEIKTSVHIRDLVNSVKVELGIGEQYIAESEGFAIRTYDLNLGQKVYINGTEYVLDSANPVKVTIEHKADKVVYTLVCKDAKYLSALRKEYGDGATVEIHTFTKNLTKEQVWASIRGTKTLVEVDTDEGNYQNLIYRGATSAYFTK